MLDAQLPPNLEASETTDLENLFSATPTFLKLHNHAEHQPFTVLG
jgi:hypothetical protein